MVWLSLSAAAAADTGGVGFRWLAGKVFLHGRPGVAMNQFYAAGMRIVSPARCWRGPGPFLAQRIPPSPRGRLRLLNNHFQDRFLVVREAVQQPSPITAYFCFKETWFFWAPCALTTIALFSNHGYIAAHRKDSQKFLRDLSEEALAKIGEIVQTRRQRREAYIGRFITTAFSFHRLSFTEIVCLACVVVFAVQWVTTPSWSHLNGLESLIFRSAKSVVQGWQMSVDAGLHTTLAVLSNMLNASNVDSYLTQWGVRNSVSIAQGELYRLLSPTFFHANVLHLAANIVALIGVGRNCELFFGKIRTITIFLLSGIAGNIFSFMLGSEHIHSLGASGAIFGLEGAVLSAFAYRQTLDMLTSILHESKPGTITGDDRYSRDSLEKRERLSEQNSQELTRSLAYITIGLIIGELLPFIDNYVHIGGVVAGVCIGFFFIIISSIMLLVKKKPLY